MFSANMVVSPGTGSNADDRYSSHIPASASVVSAGNGRSWLGGQKAEVVHAFAWSLKKSSMLVQFDLSDVLVDCLLEIWSFDTGFILSLFFFRGKRLGFVVNT